MNIDHIVGAFALIANGASVLITSRTFKMIYGSRVVNADGAVTSRAQRMLVMSRLCLVLGLVAVVVGVMLLATRALDVQPSTATPRSGGWSCHERDSGSGSRQRSHPRIAGATPHAASDFFARDCFDGPDSP